MELYRETGTTASVAMDQNNLEMPWGSRSESESQAELELTAESPRTVRDRANDLMKPQRVVVECVKHLCCQEQIGFYLTAQGGEITEQMYDSLGVTVEQVNEIRATLEEKIAGTGRPSRPAADEPSPVDAAFHCHQDPTTGLLF